MINEAQKYIRVSFWPLGVRCRGVVEWIEPEGFGVVCPGLADELVRGKAAQGLEAIGEVVGGQEGVEMRPQLGPGPMVVAFDGRLFQRPVHAFDLAVIRHDACGAASSGRALQRMVLC